MNSTNVVSNLAGPIVVMLVALIFIALLVTIWCKVFSKTGFSGYMGLLMFIPLVNIIMLFVLAFSKWPIERELEQFRLGGSPNTPVDPAVLFPKYSDPNQPHKPINMTPLSTSKESQQSEQPQPKA